MNAAAHRVEGSANAPVLYMALELSNTAGGTKHSKIAAAVRLVLCARDYVIEKGEIVLDGAGGELLADDEVPRAYFSL